MQINFQELMFAGTTHGALHVTDSGTLNIHGVRKEDGGFYICTALSVAGSSVTKAYLEVRFWCQPTLPSWPKKTGVYSPLYCLWQFGFHLPWFSRNLSVFNFSQPNPSLECEMDLLLK